MNKLIPFLLVALCFTSCIEETCEETLVLAGFDPQIVNLDVIRNNIPLCGAPIPICEATGFYVYQDYLFMVENNEGLHIFDNSDATNPKPITWMGLPGGQGLAVRNDILYMNQYTDLVAFDLSDPTTPEFIGRTEDVFDPSSVFPANHGNAALGSGEFVAAWLPTGDTRTVSCAEGSGNQFWENDRFFTESRADFSSFNTAGNATSGQTATEVVGQGGSLARFTISQSTLYAVDDNELRAFSLADPREPKFSATIPLGWGIETIFPTSDKLFIGTTTGMQIFSIEDPLAPEHLSTFEHVLSCDPVVVAGDLAYVTLWGGRDCGSTGDQLEIIDISDARNPKSVQITPMRFSHGLGVAENKLFLCGQYDGFKTFALDEDGLLGEQIDHDDAVYSRDVIVLPNKNEAIVLGYNEGGIQQYRYSEEGRLTRTSRIGVCDR